jgi:hypothetical protein
MADELKVYTPEVIEDTPFPGVVETVVDEQGTSAVNQTYKPAETTERPFVRKQPATELISSALNTQNRRILAEWQFAQSGALKIGTYQAGVSGELSLTPSGITAINTSGNTTFAIDGENGNATFAGTIQAGAVVSGQVIVGNGTWVIDGDADNPMIILYNSGVPEIVLGDV